MSITRNNHFVPQMYLKSWAHNNKRVWAYNLLVPHPNVPNWKEESLKNTGFRTDLYTHIKDNEELDEIERFLAQECETPADAPLRKAISGNSLTKEELSILLRFVAAQCVRTPAWYLKQVETWKSTLPPVFDKTLLDLSKKLETIRPNTPLPSVSNEATLLPLKVSRTGVKTGDKEFIKVESILGKGMWLFAIKHFLTDTYKVLEQHTWKVVNSLPGTFFPTSDDPVICLNYYDKDDYDFNGGWGKPGGEILFPLSPSKILYTQIGSEYHDNHFPPHVNTMIIKMIIEHAHRKVYSYKPIRSISNIHSRTVDSAIFEHERKQLEEWHSFYKRFESDYMNKSHILKNEWK